MIQNILMKVMQIMSCTIIYSLYTAKRKPPEVLNIVRSEIKYVCTTDKSISINQ